MRILITHARFLLGGAETYAVTVAEQLERLGHPVTIFADHASDEGRELAASRGLTLETGDPTMLADRDDFDAVIAQDAASAYIVAARRELPQIFVIHGVSSFEHPPQGLRPPPRIVVLNDRISRHAAALGSGAEVVRLRQPIDALRFRPRPTRSHAKRVLMFSNYLEADRMAMLESACEELGLELTGMGVSSTTSVNPQERIAEADIVVGYGRSIIEAMAMGRAAYVWERGGGDGWVTPENYEAMEADGFSGAATDGIIDRDRLLADFAAYRPELGTLAFDFIRKNHAAAWHADELVRLLEQAEPPTADPVHEALGILVRSRTRAESDAHNLEYQLRVRAEEGEHLRARIAELAPLEPRLAEAEAHLENERARREELEGQLADTLDSISWRLTAPLRTLMRWVRG